MILVLRSGSSLAMVEQALATVRGLGAEAHVLNTFDRALIVVSSDTRTLSTHLFQTIEGVEKLIPVSTTRHPLISSHHEQPIGLGKHSGTIFGTGMPILIAGPCSVESKQQIFELAGSVKQSGASALRGGAFKPRTSPYDFPGLGLDALEYMQAAGVHHNLPVVTEVMSAAQVAEAQPYVDVFQIGTRNMYNYELLREVGRHRKPILLKRAMSATVDEFLQAAEYILLEGNLQVILCERGIRTFESRTRNTLDLNAVALLKSLTDLPVIVDPSHGTGRSDLVAPLARAAIACGADGLLIEVHHQPSKSFSDAEQAITPDALATLWQQCLAVRAVLQDGREAPFNPIAVPKVLTTV